MRHEVLTCEQCKAEARADDAVNWIETKAIGIEAQQADEKPIGGEFCSDVCLLTYFRTRKPNRFYGWNVDLSCEVPPLMRGAI